MTKSRVTKAKLARAAEIAAKTGQAVTVGDFTVHPPGAAVAANDEAKALEEKMRQQMGAKR